MVRRTRAAGPQRLVGAAGKPVPSAAASPLHWLKAGLFGLLACNTAAYALTGTLSEALDSAAWFTLLLLFALETDFGERFRSAPARAAIRGTRLVAAAAVAAAIAGYVREQEWLDALNNALWVAMVAVLEVQLRYPGTAARQRARFSAASVLICGGLGALVLVWAWQREWFDAYDALLWLVAVAIVEMNVMQRLPGAPSTSNARSY